MADKKYIALLTAIKRKIREAQIKTVMAANSQLLLLYYQLGNIIIENQQQKGWGANIINQLSKDSPSSVAAAVVVPHQQRREICI